MIIGIIEKKYYDFGPVFAAEKLLECEKIKVGKEKLRQLIISHHIDYPRRKKKKSIHKWRERKHCHGQMIQMARVYYPVPKNHPWRKFRYTFILLRTGHISVALTQALA